MPADLAWAGWLCFSLLTVWDALPPKPSCRSLSQDKT